MSRRVASIPFLRVTTQFFLLFLPLRVISGSPNITSRELLDVKEPLIRPFEWVRCLHRYVADFQFVIFN
jgi:hypothetical protein